MFIGTLHSVRMILSYFEKKHKLHRCTEKVNGDLLQNAYSYICSKMWFYKILDQVVWTWIHFRLLIFLIDNFENHILPLLPLHIDVLICVDLTWGIKKKTKQKTFEFYVYNLTSFKKSSVSKHFWFCVCASFSCFVIHFDLITNDEMTNSSQRWRLLIYPCCTKSADQLLHGLCSPFQLTNVSRVANWAAVFEVA